MDNQNIEGRRHRAEDDIVPGDIERWWGLEGLDPKFVKEVRLFIQQGGMYFFGMFDRRTLVWGEDDYGKLGLGGEVKKVERPTEVMELRGKRMVKITGRGLAMMGLDEEGKVWAWGENVLGVVGIGMGNDMKWYRPTRVEMTDKIIDVRGGATHTIALGEGGRVWVWGWNGYGQLGVGGSGEGEYRDIPTVIETLGDIVQIECGRWTSWALDRKGKVYGWGRELGGRPRVMKIEGRGREVSCGGDSTLITTTEGKLYCWTKDDNSVPHFCGIHNFVSILSNHYDLFSAKDDRGQIFTLVNKRLLDDLTRHSLLPPSPTSLPPNLFLSPSLSPHLHHIFSSCPFYQSLSFTLSLNSTLTPSPPSLSLYFDHSPSSTFTFHLPSLPSLHLHQYFLSSLSPPLSHNFSTVWSNSSSVTLTKLSAPTYHTYFRYLYTGQTFHHIDLDLITLPSEVMRADFLSAYLSVSPPSLYFPPNNLPFSEYSFETFIETSKASLHSALVNSKYFRQLKSAPGVYYTTEPIEWGRVLGEGNFGEVWLGRIEDTRMAGKVLKEEKREDLMKEVKAASNLEHPNIVHFFGVVLYLQTKQMIMLFEYMDQGNLNNYLYDRNPIYKDHDTPSLPLSSQLCLSLQLARAVSYIHSRHYVHCDLAARNCLVSLGSSGLVAKVSDLGLARDVYKKPAHPHGISDLYYQAQHGAELPFRWMSPESIQDKKFTAKSDVWSFGVLLWEIMTFGNVPYSVSFDIEKIKEGRILERPNNCPQKVYNLMKRCWHKEPSERCSMDMVVEELNNLEVIEKNNFWNI